MSKCLKFVFWDFWVKTIELFLFLFSLPIVLVVFVYNLLRLVHRYERWIVFTNVVIGVFVTTFFFRGYAVDIPSMIVVALFGAGIFALVAKIWIGVFAHWILRSPSFVWAKRKIVLPYGS